QMAVPATFDEDFLNDYFQHRELISALRSGQDAVVVEIAYCLNAERSRIVAELQAAVPGVTICWDCFENDAVVANKNCRGRTNKGDAEGHIAINAIISPHYTYPDGANIMKMWTMPPGQEHAASDDGSGGAA